MLQKDFREANMQNIFCLFNVCNGSPLLSLISSQFTYQPDILSLGSCISPKHSQACWQSFEALKYFHLTHNPSRGLGRNWFKVPGSALRAGSPAELKPSRFPLRLLVCLESRSHLSPVSPHIRWWQRSLLCDPGIRTEVLLSLTNGRWNYCRVLWSPKGIPSPSPVLHMADETWQMQKIMSSNRQVQERASLSAAGII